ncbi:MAG: hypothetical protein Q9185_006228 [Variospora sp. 1 TL-2023]
MDDNDEGIRKRADNDLCVLNTFRTGTGPGSDSLVQPARQNGPLAATAGVVGEARRCRDECKSAFDKCTVDPQPGSVGRRGQKRSEVVAYQAAGNCVCAETPWRTGPEVAVVTDRTSQICSELCYSPITNMLPDITNTFKDVCCGR